MIALLLVSLLLATDDLSPPEQKAGDIAREVLRERIEDHRKQVSGYSQFRDLIQRRMRSVWRLPEGSESLSTKVLLSLSRDGRISNVEVFRSSGNEAFDNSVLEALQRASPFPPLPQNIKDLFENSLMVFQNSPYEPEHKEPEVRPPASPKLTPPKKRPAQKLQPGTQI